MPGPWEKYQQAPQVAPSQSLGRPILRKGAPERQPQNKTVKDNYVIDPETATAIPVSGLPREHWRQLTKSDGQLYVGDRPGIINEQSGEVKYGPAPASGGAGPITPDKLREVRIDAVNKINTIRDIRRQLDGMTFPNISGVGFGDILKHVPASAARGIDAKIGNLDQGQALDDFVKQLDLYEAAYGRGFIGAGGQKGKLYDKNRADGPWAGKGGQQKPKAPKGWSIERVE